MEIEIVTTKKKLYKHHLKQMKYSTFPDDFPDGEYLGYIMNTGLFGDKVFLFRTYGHNPEYILAPSTYTIINERLFFRKDIFQINESFKHGNKFFLL